VLFVTGLLVFAERLHDFCQAWLGRDLWFPDGLRFVFWSSLFLVVLAPLVAIWRNASAMALLYSQVATRGMPRKARIAPVIETGLKLLAGGMIVLWLSSLLPTEGTARWLLVWMSLLAAGRPCIFSVADWSTGTVSSRWNCRNGWRKTRRARRVGPPPGSDPMERGT
jgi:CPA2 family monovalent cation:H+ antiporter-2